jgi:hypothetical protein
MGKAAKRFKKNLAAPKKRETKSEDVVFQFKSWQKKLLSFFKKGVKINV